MVFITGKGGVGKTVVAFALAFLGKQKKKRVLLVETGSTKPARAWTGFSPQKVKAREGQGELSVVWVDPKLALEEFLNELFHFRFLARRLLLSTTFQVVAASAPGFQELLTLSQILRWENSPPKGSPYDLIVVEAPATGHFLSLIEAPSSLLNLVPWGPLAERIQAVASLLTHREKTGFLLVTSPEETAVCETIETYRHIKKHTPLFLFPPVLNRVHPARLSPQEERTVLSLKSDHPLLQAARYHIGLSTATLAALSRLKEELCVSPWVLPFLLTRKITQRELGILARALAKQEERWKV